MLNINKDDVTYDNISGISSGVLQEAEVTVDFATDNILELPALTQHKVLRYMKFRYENRKFYTWAGLTLIAVHPFEDSSNEVIEGPKAPSVDAVVSRAWFRLSNNIGKANQAVVISGDSGSGKTFSACLAIKHVAEKQNCVQGDPSSAILWQTWCSVPLLTAFGNAATGYNNNSSRFGKLMQLQFENNRIVGAFIQTFMLEKSRVSVQNPGEGNFHIFHQILESVDNNTLKALCLNKKTEYKIVPKLSNSVKSTYEDTIEALEILKIKELKEILTILSVILNLGNINFEPCFDYYTVSSESNVFAENVAKLLKTQTKNVVCLLTTRVISATSQGKRRVTCYSSPCTNPDECVERRNCLMRFLYNKLFIWLVKRINQNICKEGHYRQLGILDIYGFEVNQQNTFEQLCINYANERLQRLFVRDYLIKQQNELRENFSWQDMENIDDKEYGERIALLDGPTSIFSILNEECTLKRFSNDIFVNSRLSISLKGRRHFIPAQNAFSTAFTVKHYAGDVKYKTNTMSAKNSDKVPEEMLDFIYNCKFEFLETILQLNPYVQVEKESGRTLLSKFKKSLDSLMITLGNADLHFIKCIKPNLDQVPKSFDEEVFLEQIKANGILEILKLNFNKFSLSLSVKEFYKRFSKRLLEEMQELMKDEMLVGTSKIYLTQDAYEFFQRVWEFRTRHSLKVIEGFWQDRMKARHEAAAVIQKFFKKVSKQKLKFARRLMYQPSKGSSSSSDSRGPIRSVRMKLPVLSPNTKVKEYFKKLYSRVLDGDTFSLSIESIANNLHMKSFRRSYFYGDRVVSKTRLLQVPPKVHLPGTRITLSRILPFIERPKGLPDIL